MSYFEHWKKTFSTRTFYPAKLSITQDWNFGLSGREPALQVYEALNSNADCTKKKENIQNYHSKLKEE
jgi:hypothetical protein